MLKQIPNILTLLRLILLIPISFGFLTKSYESTFYCFAAAAFSDGLDGWLARKFDWISRFGSIADPLADKLLMFVTYSGLAWLHFIPLSLYFLVIGRDVWILLGALAYRYFIGRLDIQPSWISKINTTLQLLLVGFFLIELAFYPKLSALLNMLSFLVVMTTVISLVDYTLTWGIRAYHALKGKKHAL